MMKYEKLAILVFALAPATVLAQIKVGDELGASEMAIVAALEAQGYTTSEIEVEDGEIEVEALADTQSFEIEISSETGLVLAVYRDNDDHSDEDQKDDNDIISDDDTDRDDDDDENDTDDDND